MLRKLVIHDICSSRVADVAKIHLLALPDDVLPNLGSELLNKYYEQVANDCSYKLFGAFLACDLSGFCLLSTERAGFGSLFRSKIGLEQLIKLLFRKPKILCIGILQALAKSNVTADCAEIAFIAVSPEFQGIGIGREMLDHAKEWCNHRNISFLQTKTANQSLRQFYMKRFSAHEIRRYQMLGRCYSELRWPTSESGDKTCHV
jgi:GNAT superfamily N-acetyltransferase